MKKSDLSNMVERLNGQNIFNAARAEALSNAGTSEGARKGWESRERSLSPWDQSKKREARIAKGLRDIAAKHGVKLREPLHIDANGEYSIVASNRTTNDGPQSPTGKFGTMAEVLSKYPTRTGISATKGHVNPDNGWLRMNHFDAEQMVKDHYAAKK